MADFRDHHVKEALDRTVGPYRPEKTARARVKRIAAVAALTLAAVLAFVGIIQISTPRPANPAPAPKPGKIDVLLVPAKP